MRFQAPDLETTWLECPLCQVTLGKSFALRFFDLRNEENVSTVSVVHTVAQHVKTRWLKMIRHPLTIVSTDWAQMHRFGWAGLWGCRARVRGAGCARGVLYHIHICLGLLTVWQTWARQPSPMTAGFPRECSERPRQKLKGFLRSSF